MDIFKTYMKALSAGYSPIGSPADEPDTPELEDIDREYYVSECCGEEVNDTKNGRFICSNCCRFCCIDEDASIDKFYKEA